MCSLRLVLSSGQRKRLLWTYSLAFLVGCWLSWSAVIQFGNVASTVRNCIFTLVDVKSGEAPGTLAITVNVENNGNVHLTINEVGFNLSIAGKFALTNTDRKKHAEVAPGKSCELLFVTQVDTRRLEPIPDLVRSSSLSFGVRGRVLAKVGVVNMLMPLSSNLKMEEWR